MEGLLALSGLARSTFYYQIKVLSSGERNRTLKQTIRSIFEAHKGRYGYRRVTAAIRGGGRTVNHKTVQRLMVDPRMAPFFKNTNRERLVTASDGNLVLTLDGEPALDVLLRELDISLDQPEQAMPRLRSTLVGLTRPGPDSTPSSDSEAARLRYRTR